MTYNPNTPQGPDPINQTQPLILENFQNLGGMITGSSLPFTQLRFLDVTVKPPMVGNNPNPSPVPDPQSILTSQVGTNINGQFLNHPLLQFVTSLGTFPVVPDMITLPSGTDFGFTIGTIRINFGITANTVGSVHTQSVVFAVPYTDETKCFAQATQVTGAGFATRFFSCTVNAPGNNMNVNWDSDQVGVRAYYFAIGF